MAEGDIIKSALEIAMEKVASLGEATEEERLQWKYKPEGEKLAGRFLNNENGLAEEISGLDETARQFVTEAASAVFIKSIDLPRTETASRRTKRALDGLKLVKKDQSGLQAVSGKIDYLFQHYRKEGESQRNQAYQSLKEDMTARVQQSMQAQMGQMAAGNIDIERHPQFQQEWRKLLDRLDTAYMGHLDDCKRELAALK